MEKWNSFESTLLNSGHFVNVYSNEDAKIFKYIGGRRE